MSPRSLDVRQWSRWNRHLPVTERMFTVRESGNGATLGTPYIRGMARERKHFWTTIKYDGDALRDVPVIAESNCPQMTIYGLVRSDLPRIVRYVGRTMHPHSRFERHLRGDQGKVGPWIRETIDEMAKYVWMVQLELCEPRKGDERENFWLRFYQAEGMADLNTARVLPMRRRRLSA